MKDTHEAGAGKCKRGRLGKNRPSGLFFFILFYTKDRVRERGMEIECSERAQEKRREGLQSWSGQRLPGAKEFMVDLSLFEAALQ